MKLLQRTSDLAFTFGEQPSSTGMVARRSGGQPLKNLSSRNYPACGLEFTYTRVLLYVGHRVERGALDTPRETP
ncbi:hypothetical protein SPHINGOR109_10135 [Sphingorhabdus sp. 109]|nr:hypothetical protein SPHINGOR109_10135 [Sphingorhabdus sp. 109]